MNNAIQISITFKDIGLFVLWALLSGVLLYILLILIRFYASFKKIMKIVDRKQSEIDEVIDELPGITKNVNVISTEVAHSMEAFHNTVDNIAETSDNVTEAIAEKSGSIGKLSSVMHTVSMIKDLYAKFFQSEDVDPEEKIMVCKEVPKSKVQSEEKVSLSKKEEDNSKTSISSNDPTL